MFTHGAARLGQACNCKAQVYHYNNRKKSKTHGNKKSDFASCSTAKTTDRNERQRKKERLWLRGRSKVSCVINKIISDRLGKAQEATTKKPKELNWSNEWVEMKHEIWFAVDFILLAQHAHRRKKYICDINKLFVSLFSRFFLLCLLLLLLLEWVLKRVWGI